MNIFFVTYYTQSSYAIKTSSINKVDGLLQEVLNHVLHYVNITASCKTLTAKF